MACGSRRQAEACTPTEWTRLDSKNLQNPSGKAANAGDALQPALHGGESGGPVDPDFQRLIDAWPGLPAATRKRILRLIDAAK